MSKLCSTFDLLLLYSHACFFKTILFAPICALNRFVYKDLKRHGSFMAFYIDCKIMLYGIHYTYYSVKTVKICFHVPFRGCK